MKNVKLLLRVLFVTLFTGASVFAQTLPIPAGQAVVVIDETNQGNLETIINGDVDGDGNRVNPNRIYQLKKDKVYIMNSLIQFGGDADNNATLNIVGEEGGKMPIVLSSPLAGGDAFTNICNGSLNIKNVYWSSQSLSDKGAVLFSLHRADKKLQLEGFVSEFCSNGDLFDLRGVTGSADIIIKDSYFRNNTQFANSWNFAVVARGDNGEAIDSLWITNTTVANSGLTFFGKLNPINFLFFDHNTIVNTPKYVFFFDQYKEAYFTNNVFINCNWEGECMATYLSQLPDGVKSGVTNLDTINPVLWQNQGLPVPEMEEVKWLSSNNLHYTSEYLDKYYSGGYNTVADYPISNRDWGFLPEGVTVPTQVENVPAVFINDKTQTLINDYKGIIALDNYDNTKDPLMKTRSIKDQAEGDEYAKFARKSYGVAEEGENFDPSVMAFGDMDPTTIPGIETEDGTGITKISDFIEDFTYTEGTTSTIDSEHLGALTWWDISYDSDAALTSIKAFHALHALSNDDFEIQNNLISAYPNPAIDEFHLQMDAKIISIYNYLGMKVMSIENYKKGDAISVQSLTKGMYIITDGKIASKLLVE